MRTYLRYATLAACILGGGCSKSDETNAKSAAAPTTQSVDSGSPIAYPTTTRAGCILTGDLLGVQVSDLTGPGVSVVFPRQVASDGTISMPGLHHSVAVAGMTDGEAEQAISDQYTAEAIINHADVSVQRLRVATTGGPPPGPIGGFDLVRIAIADVQSPDSVTVRVERVDGNGKIRLPFAGAEKIANLTDQQAETAIANRYTELGTFSHPMVSVLRIEQAPPDAAKRSLPDLPINPVPDDLRWIYQTPEDQTIGVEPTTTNRNTAKPR